MIARLSIRLRARLDDVTDACVAEIVDNESAYSAGVVHRDDLWRSCRDNLDLYLQALSDPQHGPGGAAARNQAAAGDTGRRRAEQRFPLEALLHAYRVGGRVVWQGLVAEARTLGLTDTDALLDGATLVWEVMDVQSDAAASAYQQTQADLVRRGEHRAQAAFDALIDGTMTEPAALAAQARALQLPATGPFLVVSAEMSGQGGRALDQPAQALSGTGATAAWRVRPHREVGIIALGSSSAEAITGRLEEVAAGRVGVSAAVGELTEVARAMAQAELALRTVPRGCARVAPLDAHLDAALVVEAPAIARRLHRVVLGVLDEVVGGERAVLLETLQAYLDAHCSASATAAALFCHRNTVANRIRRFEQLSGMSLDDTAALHRVRLALLAEQLLGPADDA